MPQHHVKSGTWFFLPTRLRPEQMKKCAIDDMEKHIKSLEDARLELEAHLFLGVCIVIFFENHIS